MQRAICKSNKFLTSVSLVGVDRVTGEEQSQLPERSPLPFILQSGDSILWGWPPLF
ncbi:hypothetical protein [Nostoc sp. PA-18-2419]|uniref:hypothetical protein n=1 Tax=Nostoc sp. PA-18-2419 TaxID=2575443 RepID=UPI001674B03B|nr:hypothetical protein [Nostoc sp. PA-18-2419]